MITIEGHSTRELFAIANEWWIFLPYEKQKEYIEEYTNVIFPLLDEIRVCLQPGEIMLDIWYNKEYLLNIKNK
jgi:hypothetical protein